MLAGKPEAVHGILQPGAQRRRESAPFQSPFSCAVLGAGDISIKKEAFSGPENECKKKIYIQTCTWLNRCESLLSLLLIHFVEMHIQRGQAGKKEENTWGTCKSCTNFLTLIAGEDITGESNEPETRVPSVWAEEANPAWIGFEYLVGWKKGRSKWEIVGVFLWRWTVTQNCPRKTGFNRLSSHRGTHSTEMYKPVKVFYLLLHRAKTPNNRLHITVNSLNKGIASQEEKCHLLNLRNLYFFLSK